MQRNVHTRAQREFIVRRLAAFETTKDIAVSFSIMFPDTACTENDVRACDPRIVILDPELHSLFKQERERILIDPSLVPFAEQRARLIVLNRQAERYENNNQPAEARAVFRQIAEELGIVPSKGSGGRFSNDDKTPREILEIIETIIDPVQPESVV